MAKAPQRSAFAAFLTPAAPGTELAGARRLPLTLIDPNPQQARRAFAPAALHELAESIRQHGVLEPILVRPVAERYQIIAGERRVRAALLADLTDIPAIIQELDDHQAAYATAVENLQREDLDIEDEARQFALLLEVTGLSQRKLAEKLGINHVYLSRRVKLLKRPDLLAAYRAGHLGLHEVIAQVETDPAARAEGAADAGGLVEREDLPLAGGPVSQGNTLESDKIDRRAFRWRPLQQFHHWLERVQPGAIPPEDRATVRAQVAAMRTKLDQLEQALSE